jgi:hypothetical protein
VGSSFAPPALEPVDEPFLDGGADVAVDSPDAGQPVPEPLGLCGFGDFVLDEPGFVALPIAAADEGAVAPNECSSQQIHTPDLVELRLAPPATRVRPDLSRTRRLPAAPTATRQDPGGRTRG